MARILIVGIDPADVDFADPALPPGMDEATIRRGIEIALDALRAAGHVADQIFLPTDPARLDGFAARLARDAVDCVAVGGGVRLPPRNLILFEAVLNMIARARPSPAVALLVRPEDAAPAVARVLG